MKTNIDLYRVLNLFNYIDYYI